MTPYRTAIRVTGGTLLVYALLVATHLGEFWPFSIYPMFSQAGQPWTRAIVQELPPETGAEEIRWTTSSLDDLPGTTFHLQRYGVDENDLSNYVSKTSEWHSRRVGGMKSLLTGRYDLSSPLLVVRVTGRLEGDSVAVGATPVLFVSRDQTLLHPDLRTSP